MDSDDEFEGGEEKSVTPRRSGVKIVDGLDLKGFMEKGSASFTVEGEREMTFDMENDSADDSADEREQIAEELGMGKTRRRQFKTLSKAQVKDDLYKEFLTQDLSRFGTQTQVECKESSYDEISSFMENVTPDGGVKKRLLLPGWGGLIKIGQVVYIDYVITYENGDETLRSERVVDATKSPDRPSKPFRFKVGAGNVLPVFDIAIQTMEVRESAQFLARYDYAYGKLGLFGEVPEMTNVMVEILVRKVEDGSERVNIWELNPDERAELPFEEKIKAVKELKTYGNDFYKDENFVNARSKYRKGLQILDEILTPLTNETKEITDLKYTLLINMGQCRIQEKEYRRAKISLQEATEMHLPNIKKLKAFYRLAICQCELGELEKARESIDMAKSIDGSNPDIDELYMKLQKKLAKDFESEKEYARKMFQLSLNDK